jgi:ABC-2 type transport system ATP-binding protein
MNETVPEIQGSRSAQSTLAGVGSRGIGAHQVVLEIMNLTKQFKAFTAVDDLSLQLRAGEVLGFLGPNGAGKSTTVGMILGLIKPTKGTVVIASEELQRNSAIVSENIGAIIENPAFYPHMTGRDNLRALALTAGKIDEERIETLLKLVNMADRADKKYKTFSLGMKQRLGISATLLSDPAIVILDEPTNGLDPAGQREIREIIPRLGEEGHAVLLASHMLHEVEQVSDRIAIVRKGKLIREGNVEELLQDTGYIEVVVQPTELKMASQVLEQMPWVEKVTVEDGMLRVVAMDDTGSAINRALVERGIYLSTLTPKRESLEDLFLDLTEGDVAPVASETAA